jgi:hypothetical protein
MQIDVKFWLKIMICCFNLRPGLKKTYKWKRAQMCNLLYRMFQKSLYRKARYKNHLPLKCYITRIVQNVCPSVRYTSATFSFAINNGGA